MLLVHQSIFFLQLFLYNGYMLWGWAVDSSC